MIHIEDERAYKNQCAYGIKSSLSSALICTTNHRIPTRTRTHCGPERDDLIQQDVRAYESEVASGIMTAC